MRSLIVLAAWPLILLLLGCPVSGTPPMHGNVTFSAVWFSRDGRTALTLGGLPSDAGASLWDVASGRLLRAVRLGAVPGPGDGAWWVSRDLAFVVRQGAVWDLATGVMRHRLDTTVALERIVALAPDDATVYGLTADSLVAFDVATGARTAAAPRPGAGAGAGAIFAHVVISDDGRRLAFFAGGRGRDDGAVYLAELPALRVEPAAYQPPRPGDGSRAGAWTQGMAFAPDGRTLAISDRFQGVTLYDLETREVVQRLRCPFQVPLRMAIPVGYSAEGDRLVVHEGPEYPGLCLFALPSGRLVRSIPEPPDYDRRLMLVVGADRLVAWRRGLGPFEVFDLATGELLREFCPMPGGCVSGGGPQARLVALAPDGRSLFVSDRKHVNGVWDIATGRLRYWLVDPERPRPW